MQTLIFYSKPGCHLCEGLAEKLAQVQAVEFELEMRDITTNPRWFELYQYEIPVLCLKDGDKEIVLPRFSPRVAIASIEKKLTQYLTPKIN
ncbi:MAG: glutaredoxin family protein [Limnothrix sp.]